MESFQINCFPFPFSLPARRKAADNPTVELVLAHVQFHFSLVSICLSPPATGKVRNEAKEAQRQMGTAVWKIKRASDPICRARESRQHARCLVSYGLHKAKVISYISTSCSSLQQALMRIPVFKINRFTTCREEIILETENTSSHKRFCMLFNSGQQWQHQLMSNTVEILTLEKVRDQKSSCIVAAGQSFLCQVSLDLQCKQVPERELQVLEF